MFYPSSGIPPPQGGLLSDIVNRIGSIRRYAEALVVCRRAIGHASASCGIALASCWHRLGLLLDALGIEWAAIGSQLGRVGAARLREVNGLAGE